MFDSSNPYKEVAEELADEVYVFDPDLLGVPKLIRKRSANMAGAKITRMLRKKLFDYVRFSGLTGVRTVSDDLSLTHQASSEFAAASDQTMNSNRNDEEMMGA